MIARKSCKVTLSKKFPDGSLASLTIGTDIEKETEDLGELFLEVMDEIRKDFETASQKDQLDKSIIKSIARQLKNERKVEEARKSDD